MGGNPGRQTPVRTRAAGWTLAATILQGETFSTRRDLLVKRLKERCWGQREQPE